MSEREKEIDGERSGDASLNTSSATSALATDTSETTDISLLELTARLGEKVGRGKRKEASSREVMAVPPSGPPSGVSILAHKIWIGNLDKRLSQENVLKFVSRYGSLVSFRFNFKAGTDIMEPRGYCFVEYSTREEAERAKAALDGKIALGKKIVVDWAHVDPANKKNEDGVSETWDPSVVSETLDKGVSTSAKIAALEAKLKAMEEGKSLSVSRVSDTLQRPWIRERSGKRQAHTRRITQPIKRGRTHKHRAKGPYT